MMIRIALCVLALVTATSSFADASVSAAQEEIDRTVWKVFQQAFEQMDGAALNSVYADNALRVTPAGIDTDNQFRKSNETRFAANIANGDSIALDFWFDSRQTNRTTSYDVGFYRMRMTSAAGSSTDFYGQFHIVLRNIAGRWKIVQDWDTASIGGLPITAADFKRQTPIRF